MKVATVWPPGKGAEYHHPCSTASTSIRWSGWRGTVVTTRTKPTRRCPPVLVEPTRRISQGERPVASTKNCARTWNVRPPELASSSQLPSGRRVPPVATAPARSRTPARGAADTSMASKQPLSTCQPAPQGSKTKSVVKGSGRPQTATIPGDATCPSARNRSHRPSSARTGRTAGGRLSPMRGVPPNDLASRATACPASAKRRAVTAPAGPPPTTTVSTFTTTRRGAAAPTRRRRPLRSRRASR
jgi:hypothetical protein